MLFRSKESIKRTLLRRPDLIEKKEFTKEEYEEFHKRLVEYSFLKEQLEYHRKSIESHNRQMELILLSITNKRFIEEDNESRTYTKK